jgi:Putative redox-active protein (C_GCAxxG_C_C)
MSEHDNSKLSRRAFLGRSAVTAGVVVTGAIGSARCGATAQAQAAPPSVPWPVPQLNPDVVRDAGYWGYWANDPWKKTNYGCSYGVASALLASIGAGLGAGSPWEALPLEMFKWGKTGAVEAGTLCGALAGALPIFSLAAPTYVVEMGSDLLRWYQETALPSSEMDYLDGKRPYPGQAQSVSGSPLCHISVSLWCKASGKLASSTDRKARCGKVTGDVAKMAATLLNRVVPGGGYTSIYPALGGGSAYEQCVHCHIDAPPPPTPDAVRLSNSLGVSTCKTCHPDAQPVMTKK